MWENLVLFFLAFIIYLSGFDLFSLSNFSNFPLMNNFDISSLGTPYFRISVAAFVSVSLWSRIWESSPKLSKILTTTKHYKKTFLIKQLLSCTNSRFKTQTLKSSATSCLYCACSYESWENPIKVFSSWMFLHRYFFKFHFIWLWLLIAIKVLNKNDYAVLET